jgi:hypothetical protein
VIFRLFLVLKDSIFAESYNLLRTAAHELRHAYQNESFGYKAGAICTISVSAKYIRHRRWQVVAGQTDYEERH